MQIDTQTLLVIVGATAGVFTLANLTAAFQWWVISRLDNSRLSAIARELGHAPPATSVAPKTSPDATNQASNATMPVPYAPAAEQIARSPAAPVPTAAPQTVTLTGKISWFGGPDDKGVAPDEGLALYEPSEAGKIAGFLLKEQPAGTTGLAHRLDPNSLYMAYRWDYHQTPRAFLQTVGVHVTANGKTIVCRPVDWGPNVATRRIADLSPGAMAALGLKTDDVATVTIPLPVPGIRDQASGIKAATGEPPWLTWARREKDTKEEPGNRGPAIRRYISLAHCGAEGDPWCAIFANAALEDCGVPGTRSALAQSFTSHPGFIKLDAPVMGAIAVFWRGSRDSGQGHVGFYTGEDATHVQVLGGNEDDQVEIKVLPKASSSFGLLGYWWPTSVPASTSAQHQVDAPKVT